MALGESHNSAPQPSCCPSPLSALPGECPSVSVSPTWPPVPGPPCQQPAGPRPRCRCVCLCSDGAGQWSPVGGQGGSQDCFQKSFLELGTFSKFSLWVPLSFCSSTGTELRRTRTSPDLCLPWQSCCGTHNLHLAGGPAAVGGGEDGGAALAVAGPLPIPQHAAHRHRVDAVGVPVAVAVVVVGAAVARGPDEDGAEPAPALLKGTGG